MGMLSVRVLCFLLSLGLVTTLFPLEGAAMQEGQESQVFSLPPEPTAEGEALLPVLAQEAPPALTASHIPYLLGLGDRRIDPEGILTKAQAVQMVHRLLENPGRGTLPCSYQDIPQDAWYRQAALDLCALGLLEDGPDFHGDHLMSRGGFVYLLAKLVPQAAGTSSFSDVPPGHWAYAAVGTAVSQGWIQGFPDGTFRPEGILTRAEASVILNRVTGRTGDAAQSKRLLSLGLYRDLPPTHWAAAAMLEALLTHTPSQSGAGEYWSGLNLGALKFTPGFHTYEGQLFYADREGKLTVNTTLGAYVADSQGVLTLTAPAYQMPYVPYISQIDNIYAWVGCEAVAALAGLKAKGFATNTQLRPFLDNLPRAASDPEKGFVGSPYVPDPSKRTRTTIYPAKLAEYCNLYCGGAAPCVDFRGASIQELQQELLAGNCVVAYETLWWATPFYRNYNIEGTTQRLVSNNHAVLVYGYDPARGYLISDPYNYYNRGQVYQYWENAATFEAIWNERHVGMVIR